MRLRADYTTGDMKGHLWEGGPEPAYTRYAVTPCAIMDRSPHVEIAFANARK
jgi:hypothetical protein